MVTRRDFLKLSSFSAAMLAGGKLPVLAANTKRAKHTYPITDFHSYVSEFSPVSGKRIRNVKELTYDYLLWEKYDKRQDVTAAVKSGSLTINSLGKTNVITDFHSFTVDNRTKKEISKTRLVSDYTFDGSLTGGVKKWDITGKTFSLNKDMSAYGSIKEHGEIKNSVMTVQSGRNKPIKQKTAMPMIPEWSLPLIVPMISKDQGFTGSMLRDSMFYFPNQNITYCGTVDIRVAGGKKITLDNWLHTGTGVLPTNYLVDQNGVTQLVTYGLVALALQSVR